MGITTSSSDSGSRFLTSGPLTPSLPPVDRGKEVASLDSDIDTSLSNSEEASVDTPEETSSGSLSYDDSGQGVEQTSLPDSYTTGQDESSEAKSEGNIEMYHGASLPGRPAPANCPRYLNKQGEVIVTPSLESTTMSGDNRPAPRTNLFEAIRRYGHDEDFSPVEDDEGFVPTSAPAGSPEKIDVLAERIRQGFPLFHEEDRVDYSGLIGAIRPRD